MPLVEVIRNRKVTIVERFDVDSDTDVLDSLHIETHGQGHQVYGRHRLEPSDEFSLRREIRAGDLGTPALPDRREPRSAAMRARLGYPPTIAASA